MRKVNVGINFEVIQTCFFPELQRTEEEAILCGLSLLDSGKPSSSRVESNLAQLENES
jgi:hypothetical protein